MKCLLCQKEFQPKRSTAKFCSTAHRVAFSRKAGVPVTPVRKVKVTTCKPSTAAVQPDTVSSNTPVVVTPPKLRAIPPTKKVVQVSHLPEAFKDILKKVPKVAHIVTDLSKPQ